MVVQSAQAAIDNANAQHTCDPGYCLKYVRTWQGIPSAAADAQGAWDTAIGKHPGDRNPPPAAPVFWKSSASGSGHGHIAMTKHNPPMRTTDKPTGQVGNDDGSYPHDVWGQTYLGWAEGYNGVRLPYLGESEDWRAGGDVYVSKLHKGQQDSDSVSRLRYRLQNHAHMPGSHKPGYGAGYGQECLEAVRYWQRNLDPQRPKGPQDGSHLDNGQANRLFGDNYTVIED